MDQDLPDDFFIDDLDLDDLPVDTLVELEQAALRSTQANNRIAKYDPINVQSPSSDFDLEEEDVVNLDAQQSYASIRQPPPPSKPIDEVAQREQWRKRRYGAPGQNEQDNRPSQPAINGGVRKPAVSISELPALSQPAAVTGSTQLLDGNLDVSDLQRRIAEVSPHHTPNAHN